MFRKKDLFIDVLLFMQFLFVCYALNETNSSAALFINSSFSNLSDSLSSNGVNSSKIVANAPISNAGISMNIVPSLTSTTLAGASTTSTSNLVVILVSLIVVACVIVVIIGALFVMRRRFDLWRGGMGGNKSLNNEKTINDDGETGVASNETETNTNENPAENMPENLTSIDNKQAVVQIEQQQLTKQQAEEQTVQENGGSNVEQQIPKQKSSTSVIANVLNELSESVVAKLSSSSQPSDTNDPEKEPLNTTE